MYKDFHASPSDLVGFWDVVEHVQGGREDVVKHVEGGVRDEKICFEEGFAMVNSVFGNVVDSVYTRRVESLMKELVGWVAGWWTQCV